MLTSLFNSITNTANTSKGTALIFDTGTALLIPETSPQLFHLMRKEKILKERKELIK